MKVILLQLLLLLVYSNQCWLIEASCSNANVNWEYEWKYVDFDWESEDQKKEAISTGDYDPEAVVLYDVEKVPNGKVFVTAVREKGVPASLLTVTNKMGKGGRLLRPYPDWSWAKKGGITSAYRIATDSCNRLWVLDCGKIGEETVAPAQLLAFDLNTDKMVHKIEIPKEVAYNKNGKGLLVTPIVHIIKDCNRIRVYMADVEGYGLVVWNTTNLWRIESDSFLPDPKATHFDISGSQFELADGILGMSVYQPRGAMTGEAGQRLYYRALSSYQINSISTVLLNRKYNGTNSTYYESGNGSIHSRSAPMAFIPGTSILISGAVERNAIMSWDCDKSFEDKNLKCLAHDEKKIQFTSGLKFYPDGRNACGKIVMLNNRFQLDASGQKRDLSQLTGILIVAALRSSFLVISDVLEDTGIDVACIAGTAWAASTNSRNLLRLNSDRSRGDWLEPIGHVGEVRHPVWKHPCRRHLLESSTGFIVIYHGAVEEAYLEAFIVLNRLIKQLLSSEPKAIVISISNTISQSNGLKLPRVQIILE